MNKLSKPFAKRVCEVCGGQASKSTIIEEIYYRDICMTCYTKMTTYSSPSSGQAEYNRGRDTEDHLADIIQPTNGDGKPSAEFIHLYADKAKAMFSDDELNQATRS